MTSPNVPSNIIPALRQFLMWVRQKITGGGMDKLVTFGDLVSMGLVNADMAKKQSEK